MWVYLYPSNTETPLKEAYIGIPSPTSIVLDKSSISLTTIWQTEQLTATIEPTVSDHSVTWSSDDTTIATVSTTGLVTCVTPWECTITATTVNGLTASCSVENNQGWQPWVNTIAYYDFNNQSLADTSWNNNDATWYNWTWSFISVATWNYCANLWWSHAIELPFTIWWRTAFTFNEWVNIQAFNKSSGLQWILWTRNWASWVFHSNINNSKIWEIAFGDGSNWATYQTWMIANTWYNIWIVKNWTTYQLYWNWTLVWSCTATASLSSSYTWYVGTTYTNDRYLDGYVDSVIFESVARTRKEMSDYFNQTKTLYGIS